jgi:hypothetical protein
LVVAETQSSHDAIAIKSKELALLAEVKPLEVRIAGDRTLDIFKASEGSEASWSHIYYLYLQSL